MREEMRMGKKKGKRRGNGEGTVCLDEKKGLWVAQLMLGYNSEGKLIRPTSYHKSQKEALAALTRLRNDKLNGRKFDPSQQTVAEFLLSWLEDSVKGAVTFNGCSTPCPI